MRFFALMTFVFLLPATLAALVSPLWAGRRSSHDERDRDRDPMSGGPGASRRRSRGYSAA
jgi:hypothetical protein